MSWNFGDMLDAMEAELPGERPALVHGEQVLSWRELSERSNRLARALIARGAKPGDKVALYLRNRPEYLVTLCAAFKARLVHVNVNYRYLDDELHYLFENSDSKFVVFGDEFRERVAGLVGRLPGVSHWLQVGGVPADPAESFAACAAEGEGGSLGIPRSPDDLLFIYTGGTTGLPKGVMWRHEDLWGAMGGGATIPAHAGVAPADLEAHLAGLRERGAGPVQIPACPLMHGTGLLSTILNLMAAGTIVTLSAASFDAEEFFDTVERRSVQAAVIVGDAFARPLLEALDAQVGRWQLDSLRLLISSGVMWSLESKRALLHHLPRLRLADLFGSSEALGFGSSVTTLKEGVKTARFAIGDHCRVFSEDHREVQPGSGERGFIARSGWIPLGYYKDPEKTARTFPSIGGVRYSVPGDWCRVEADGTLTLLGRGSVCINTAGEKVYPEEVEEVLKAHAAVRDALVVGLPDPKWGQAVTALVEACEGAKVDEEELRGHVRSQLASYKTPKRVFPVERMFRAVNGKPDYKAAADFAARRLGEVSLGGEDAGTESPRLSQR